MNLLSLIKQYGIRDLAYRYFESKDTANRSAKYLENISSFLPTETELTAQRNAHFDYEPTFSIVVPAYETKEVFLKELVDSVLGQTYGKLELIIADGSKSDIVRKYLENYNDDRIVYIKLKENTGISGNTNEGFSYVNGDYVALLDHDDVLTLNALYEMVKVLNEVSPRPDMVYSDEDKLNQATGQFTDPSFKPDYNEYFLRHVNYICHFLIYSKELLDKVGGLDAAYDGAQDHEFILRCAANGAKIAHIPRILYHWRIHPESTAADPNSKLYAFNNGMKAIEKYLKSVGDPGQVSLTKDLGIYTIKYDMPKDKLKVLVLSENESQLNRMKKTAFDGACDYYSKCEITWKINSQHNSAADNKSCDNNLYNNNSCGTSSCDYSSYDYIVCTKHAAVPATKNWLGKMLRTVTNKNVAIVAAKCLGSDNKVLSCGATYQISTQGSNVVSLYEGINRHFHGYNHRAIDVTTNVSLDPLYMAIMKSDVFCEYQREKDVYALCLKLNNDGKHVLVDTEIVAKVSGVNQIPNKLSDKAISLAKKYDPYYTPSTSIEKGQFLL